jgi:6-phosphogluconolactonase
MLQFFIDEAKKNICERDNFYFAISGGNTPMGFYKLLGNSETAKQINWSKIHLFWVDERMVSKDSPESNYRLAAETFLDKAGLREHNIHRIPTELGDYKTCLSAYQKDLKDTFGLGAGQVPQFDLILLGMGGDGHTASLFPGSPNLENNSPEKLAAVEYTKGLDRITFTPLLLTEAKKIIVLVTGEDKAEILNQVFNTKPDKLKFPVHLLWETPEKVTFLTDKSAAEKL